MPLGQGVGQGSGHDLGQGLAQALADVKYGRQPGGWAGWLVCWSMSQKCAHSALGWRVTAMTT
jgi:hypothetical protein